MLALLSALFSALMSALMLLALLSAYVAFALLALKASMSYGVSGPPGQLAALRAVPGPAPVSSDAPSLTRIVSALLAL